MNSIDLKNFRSRHQLSQNDLAEIVGKKVRAIQSWEQGNRNIPQSVIMLLENYERNVTGGTNLSEPELNFTDLKIDDKLNFIYNQNIELLKKYDRILETNNKREDQVRVIMENIEDIRGTLYENTSLCEAYFEDISSTLKVELSDKNKKIIDKAKESLN